MRLPVPKLLAGVGLIIAIAFAATRLPLATWSAALVDWVRDAGALGVVVFAIVYVSATVGMLPGSVLTLGAGFVYGPIGGTLLVSPVSVIAATAAFLLGRTAARPWVARRLGQLPRFDAIDRAVCDAGFRIVLLLRLSPIVPFTALNYALGLTGVRTRDYVLGSWLGMLPGTILYVYLGSLITSASQLGQGGSDAPGLTRWAYWAGLVATVGVVVLVTRTARAALNRSLLPSLPHPESR